jgi:polyhydroxybutyrate depolymerase
MRTSGALLAACFALVPWTAGVAAPAPDEPASVSGTLQAGGLARTYHLYRPPELAGATSAPLVVVLHGGFGHGTGAERLYHWDAAARRHRFVVVYPDGIGTTWNAGSCCGTAARRNIDDVGFLSALVQRLEDEIGIDPRRVYVTGMSNGAIMAYRMACEAPFPIAAIGPVAGTLGVPCDRARPTSVLHIHGSADRNIPFGGSVGIGFQRGARLAVPEALARWRELDRCAQPVTTTEGAVATQRSDCADGRVVELITIAGAGHQWPGGERGTVQSILGMPLDAPSTALDATETLWTFFATQIAPPAARVSRSGRLCNPRSAGL